MWHNHQPFVPVLLAFLWRKLYACLNTSLSLSPNYLINMWFGSVIRVYSSCYSSSRSPASATHLCWIQRIHSHIWCQTPACNLINPEWYFFLTYHTITDGSNISVKPFHTFPPLLYPGWPHNSFQKRQQDHNQARISRADQQNLYFFLYNSDDHLKNKQIKNYCHNLREQKF